MLDQLAAVSVQTTGAWLFPFSAAGQNSALLAFWAEGTLRNLSFVTLPASGDRAKELKDQLAHIVWAEQLWLHRWKGKTNPVAQGTDLHSLAEVRERWEGVAAERGAFLAMLKNLDDTRVVKPSSGGEYVHTFRQMFRHVINHSSYHRGQVVSFLRQLGSKPPDTDLITYYRRKAVNQL